jgi:predicted dehydrogenase
MAEEGGALSGTTAEVPRLRWGVLGCGIIANEMADALASEGRNLAGVANRTHDKAVAFAERHGIPKVYDAIDDLFADPDIDAVYITTPHNTHITYLRRALAAGKHVMCEKSITLNSAELEEAKALAAENHVVLMDACTILHMPLYKELARRAAAGDFGRVNLVQENFGSYKVYDMANRFFNPKLAGGAMLDIGVYSISLARLFLASKPKEVVSLENLAPTDVDESSGIVMRNDEGQLVVLSLSLHSKQPKRAVISCDKAYVEIMEYPRADVATIVWTEDGRREELRAGKTAHALSYVLADLEAAVAGRQQAFDNLDVSTDVMSLMTRLRADWGVVYPEEV